VTLSSVCSAQRPSAVQSVHLSWIRIWSTSGMATANGKPKHWKTKMAQSCFAFTNPARNCSGIEPILQRPQTVAKLPRLRHGIYVGQHVDLLSHKISHSCASVANVKSINIPCPSCRNSEGGNLSKSEGCSP